MRRQPQEQNISPRHISPRDLDGSCHALAAVTYSHLSQVSLAHEGGEEGVRVTNAIRGNDSFVCGQAISPVISKAALPSALNEEQYVRVDCIDGIHGSQVQISSTCKKNRASGLGQSNVSKLLAKARCYYLSSNILQITVQNKDIIHAQ